MASLTKRDRNHAEIAEALRRAGCSVYDSSRFGGGFPDLTVGRYIDGKPVTFLREVKDGSLPPSHRKLNDREKAWHAMHKGHVAVVLSVEEALAAVGLTA